jgi:hypothetical protein
LQHSLSSFSEPPMFLQHTGGFCLRAKLGGDCRVAALLAMTGC